RGKIEAAINNAQKTCDLIDECGSLGAFFWQFEPDKKARPKKIDHKTLIAMPETPESIALSKALKKRGFKFVGPTTMYAHMQAMGMVNDHLEGCCVRDEIEKIRSKFKRPV
ncbi:MAG TPA: DNA-3-methyladenine glycosylase I, partial [Rhodospirillaceae bacterium]|nr:DNA-3-methyladenine glycosylase I [Rhodospirillaceae bacterium]